MAQQQVKVSNEISALKRVIVHKPDEGISRISPKRAEELLFDDIVHLPQMQEEHEIFTNVLKSFVGENNVFDTEQLLREALKVDPEHKQEMIDMIVNYEEMPNAYKQILENLPDDTLARVLITGYYADDDHFLFDPIPNFIFTRDIAVVVNDHVIITKPAKEARFRENFLTRFIFWSHPIFRQLRDENRILNLNRVDQFPPSKRGEAVSIEGGDVMIFNEDYLLIGCSERTTSYAIQLLSQELFERNVVKNVVQVNIPTDRYCMHIDTIFTHINTNHVMAYKPIVLEGLSSYVEVHRKEGSKGKYHSLKDFLLEEINPNMEFICSGNGESPYQEREQWTDGCNMVAVKPGVALTYDRNPKTEEALIQYGYQMIPARTFNRGVANGTIDPQTIENTIITLPSNELSRARGGSHCMTCPIERVTG